MVLSFSSQSASKEIDSLLRVLDEAISQRDMYTQHKEESLRQLKNKLSKETSLEAQYHINDEIISEYQSFKCDSALIYVNRNTEIAKAINNEEYLNNSRLKHAFVLSMSGLFTPALEILESINYSALPSYLKVLYCWTYIRYNENLIKYLDNSNYEKHYLTENLRYRDSLLTQLNEDSDMYLKEKAFKLQAEGAYNEAADIFLSLFKEIEPDTHGYAMCSMSLAAVYEKLQEKELQEKYLIQAAITDVRLAVKENEALLALAIFQHKKGDVDRAFNYIHASLEDANFYNSRFRNAVIARVHPIIEDTYLTKIGQQKRNLRFFAFAITGFVIILIITLCLLYKQNRIVSNAKRHLKSSNDQLISLNQKLDEANHVRERYIGYYINQCAVYLDKLESYRKYVHRKIRGNQIKDLQKMTSSNSVFEKDIEELYEDFDKTFCEIYPNFVEEFNSLLREDEQYKLERNQLLNTELRIFALVRLGITDVKQIATFLRYSVQTIYNYKSKVKSKAIIDSEIFEERVRKIECFRDK